MSIGKLNRVPLREVWRHEAFDFTRWLEENVDVLNEILDINLVSIEREKSAGDFNVDLVGEDEDGKTVVIENQLEVSDHDHLGKVLTYLATLDADVAVWIVARPRPEHIKTITWLNESTSTPFYFVQVEAVRIGESDPAPLLTKLAGPSEEARAAGNAKKELSERHRQRRRFWTLLLEHARTKTRLHANISPTPYNWLGTGTGIRGLAWNYSIRKNDSQVELYIDRGDKDENEQIFDQLAAHRDAVDEAFGAPLDWQLLEGRRGCRIRYRIARGGWQDEESWPDVAEGTVQAMIKLEAVLGLKVAELKLRV